MPDALLALCRTSQTCTAPEDHFAFYPVDIGPAHRTLTGQFDLTYIIRPLSPVYRNDLGDHIASSLNQHRVTDKKVQPRNLIHIMQRCIADSDSANIDRFQSGYRCYRTRTTYLKFNIQKNSPTLCRRKICGAIAHLGVRVNIPRDCCWSMRSTLYTTPSMS